MCVYIFIIIYNHMCIYIYIYLGKQFRIAEFGVIIANSFMTHTCQSWLPHRTKSESRWDFTSLLDPKDVLFLNMFVNGKPETNNGDVVYHGFQY